MIIYSKNVNAFQKSLSNKTMFVYFKINPPISKNVRWLKKCPPVQKKCPRVSKNDHNFKIKIRKFSRVEKMFAEWKNVYNLKNCLRIF